MFTLNPKQAIKIVDAAWGRDAVQAILGILYRQSDNFEGFESYQDYFDVSYIGSVEDLSNEIIQVYNSCGIDVDVDYRNTNNTLHVVISYDNDGTEVYVTISQSPEYDEYTLSEDSTGYYVLVEEVY